MRAEEIFVYIVPLDPFYKTGLAGHMPFAEFDNHTDRRLSFEQRKEVNGDGMGTDKHEPF